MPTPSDQPARSTVALEQENATLHRQVAHLQRVCDEQQTTMGQLQSRLESMAEQITLLKKALFGRRRERFLPSAEQKLLFTPESLESDGEQESSSESDEDEEEPEQAVKRRRRRRRKRFEFPQCLPVKRIEHPLAPEELACPCGCGDRVVIREHVTKQLELEPSSAYVAEHVRYTYACPHCRGGDRMVTTQKPETANEKGIFGPTALAYLADGKFVRHLPLYRQQEQLRHACKMWFSRGVLSGSLCRTAMRLRPLRDLIHAEILLSFYLHADETTARLLSPGQAKALLAYLWAYAGDVEHPYVLFDFHQSRSRAGPREILGEYRGGLLTDGHSAYVSLVKESDGRLLDLGCWAHYPESDVIWSGLSYHDRSRVSLQRQEKIAPDNGEPDGALRSLGYYAKESAHKGSSRYPRTSRHAAIADKRVGREVHRDLHHLGPAISCSRSQGRVRRT